MGVSIDIMLHIESLLFCTVVLPGKGIPLVLNAMENSKSVTPTSIQLRTETKGQLTTTSSPPAGGEARD